jgi:hypothetical protein
MPSGAGRRARAGITNAENAKNTPAIAPQPSAVTTVSPTSPSLIACLLSALER